jgi:co-chaperonin GroES (HSP10)
MLGDIMLKEVYGKRVLIKRLKEQTTKGGLMLPDNVRETSYAFTGQVMMLGTEVEDKALLHQRVVVNKYPQSASWLDENTLICLLEDVIALCE